MMERLVICYRPRFLWTMNRVTSKAWMIHSALEVYGKVCRYE